MCDTVLDAVHILFDLSTHRLLEIIIIIPFYKWWKLGPERLGNLVSYSLLRTPLNVLWGCKLSRSFCGLPLEKLAQGSKHGWGPSLKWNLVWVRGPELGPGQVPSSSYCSGHCPPDYSSFFSLPSCLENDPRDLKSLWTQAVATSQKCILPQTHFVLPPTPNHVTLSPPSQTI